MRYIDVVFMTVVCVMGLGLAYHFMFNKNPCATSQPAHYLRMLGPSDTDADRNAGIYVDFAQPYKYLPPGHDQYTSHRCMGGAPMEVWQRAPGVPPFPLGWTPDFRFRTCIFRNICFLNNTFYYHQNPKSVIPWDDTPVHSGPLQQPPEPLVRLDADLEWAGSGYRKGTGSDWTPTVRNEPIPASAVFANESVAHFFFTRAQSLNIGHNIGDDMLSLFLILQMFGFADSDVQLLLQDSCRAPRNTLGNTHAVPQCKKLQRKCYNFLNPDRPPLDFLDIDDGQGRHPRCFPIMIAGAGPYGYHNAMNYKGDIFTQFRDWMYFKFGMARTFAPLAEFGQRPVITVIRKNGRHRFINHDDFVAHLRKTYTRFDVNELDGALLTMDQEIAMMQNTTLLIAPPGGSGFSCMFLPDNAVGIFGGYCQPNHERTGVNCNKMDGYFWASLPYFKHLHYYQRDPAAHGDENSYNITFSTFDLVMDQAMEVIGMKSDIWPIPPHSL
eukprot:TRINITY_DN3598_c0_g1_i1.p1 TRINITY_DN3598_c0_g1~~TRINITY_DN3598_c0_g1_i1.p1  ORF type:complete len:496 (+),score=155.28 TRINITY_DN3598_c0_g1_i1:1271-2758(+)